MGDGVESFGEVYCHDGGKKGRAMFIEASSDGAAEREER